MRGLTVCFLSLLFAPTMFGQTPDDALAFEVASIRVHPPDDPSTKSTMTGGPGTADPGRITAYNRMLRSLINEAYGIRSFQIEHPDWMGEARYDIVAKVPPGTTKPQARIMMRNLLRDRFQLRLRRESRMMDVYVLVVGKNGPKMKGAVPPGPEDAERSSGAALKPKSGSRGVAAGAPGIFTSYNQDQFKAAARSQSTAKLVTWLTTLLDRPVIDQTGLKGDYDFDLAWPAISGPAADVIPEINEAIERQIGLKLETRKMPVPVLIIESALKVPIEN